MSRTNTVPAEIVEMLNTELLTMRNTGSDNISLYRVKNAVEPSNTDGFLVQYKCLNDANTKVAYWYARKDTDKALAHYDRN